MKKFSIMMAFMGSGLFFTADASYTYTTRCGIQVQTVSKEAFANDDEWREYCAELDEAYCGKLIGGGEGLGHFIGNIGDVAP